jgi:hypothetical protein
MKPEFRRELAQLPFEEKIRKAGELIRFSRKFKTDGSKRFGECWIQRRRAQRICSRARLELTTRGCRAVKPVAGEVVVIPFPRPDAAFGACYLGRL